MEFTVEQALRIALEHHQAGRLAEAEKIYAEVLKAQPEHPEALHLAGVVSHQRGNSALAVGLIEQALRASAPNPTYLNNLGEAYRALGMAAQAERRYRAALSIEPDVPELLNNLGLALVDLGRGDEAMQCYRRALALNPGYAKAQSNLGAALLAGGRIEDAERAIAEALKVEPDYAEAHSNHGAVLMALGRLEEAEASYRRALRIKPRFPVAHSGLIFLLDLLEGRGVEEQQAERRRWDELNARQYGESVAPHANSADPRRKLRIGYVSADFRRHSAYYLFGPVIRNHDRSRFEVFCYSGVQREDDATARMREAADAWRVTVAMSDDALAEQIRRDAIDILVDLSGHSARNRLLAFARKPAPIQVTAWGHATGTGLTAMDYLLVDPRLVPQRERGLFAECIVDLPCWACYEPPEYLPSISPLPALKGEAFTFGCLNRVEKISHRTLALWGRILTQLPEARILVKAPGLDDPTARRQFVDRAAKAGVDPRRLQVIGFSPHVKHLKAFEQVDVALDPFPHGGGVSTAEALWMGVPVVTLEGSTPANRASASILGVIGMTEWSASNEAEYVRIAVQASSQPHALDALRRSLRERLIVSPFGDAGRYCRAVEKAYGAMWRSWIGRTTSR